MADIQLQLSDITGKVQEIQRQILQLSKLIESLARIEENLINQKDDVNGFGNRLAEFDGRMRNIEIKLAISASQGTATSRWVERIVMFVVIAALGALNFFKDKS